MLELLRCADLESLRRRQGATAAKISAWREECLVGGDAALKRCVVAVEADETRRLKSVAAELATDREFLPEKVCHLEAAGPSGW